MVKRIGEEGKEGASYSPPAVGMDELSSARATTSNMFKKEAASQPQVMGSKPRYPRLYQRVPGSSVGVSYKDPAQMGIAVNTAQPGHSGIWRTSKTRKQPEAGYTEGGHGPEVESALHVLFVPYVVQLFVLAIGADDLTGVGRWRDRGGASDIVRRLIVR